MTILTMLDAEAAKAQQVADVVSQLQAVQASIEAMRTSEVGGIQLWTGGLPRDVTQVENLLLHNIGLLRQTFGLPDEPGSGEPTLEQLLARVDAERDRRIDGGFTFEGQVYQSRPSDRENVMGAAQLAMGAIGQGAQPGDLRWADPDEDFVWITADNQLVPLDAPQVVALFQAGVAFKSALTFHARALKDALLEAADPLTVNIETGWPE